MVGLPVHQWNALIVTRLASWLVGAGVGLLRRFRSGDFWCRSGDEGVRVVSLDPTLLAFVLADPADHDTLDLSRFQHLICGAGPLTVELARRFEERFGHRIVHGYGLSETTCYSCFLPVDLDADTHAHWMRSFGFPSIGVPLPPNEMAIHDPDGRALGPRERGEIVIRGVNVMRGYFRRPEANAEAFAHGWFRSGDEGFFEFDAQGRSFFFITGRLKELIIRGGVNLSPFEIDEVLNRVPGVRCALAVGFENDWYGEEVGAFVQREEGATVSDAEILAACRACCRSRRRRRSLCSATTPVTRRANISAGGCGRFLRSLEDHAVPRAAEALSGAAHCVSQPASSDGASRPSGRGCGGSRR